MVQEREVQRGANRFPIDEEPRQRRRLSPVLRRRLAHSGDVPFELGKQAETGLGKSGRGQETAETLVGATRVDEAALPASSAGPEGPCSGQ